MAPKHVLVVDDSPDNRGLLAQLMRREGHRVSEASNGAEALDLIARDRPDLIFLDLMMPVLDGYQLLSELRAANGDFLPVIVISAVAEREARLRALTLGANEFLLKPIDREEVIARVRTLLALKEAKEAVECRAEQLEALVAERTQKLTDAYRKLNRAYEDLKQTERHKDDFLSVISHELRTPLNFITGFGSLLQDEVSGALNPEQHDYLAKMLEGADRMLHLVDDLLDIAKIQAGKLDCAPRPTRYADLVRDVVETLRPLADRKAIALEIDVYPSLCLMIDGPRIVQVLTNLVGNAIKFTPEHGGIHVKAFSVNGSVITQVVDSGKGISAEDIPHLFTRFKQLDMTSTREAGGVGLGLAISKAIVESHGGSIGLLSEPGQGSTFWFALPDQVVLGSEGSCESSPSTFEWRFGTSWM